MDQDQRSSLNPTLLHRLRQLLQPDWVHTVAARRAAAAALVLLAGVAALRDNPDGERGRAVVAARDISPGIKLSAEDIRVENRLSETLPDGFAVDPEKVIGSTTAGPVRRGEVITDVRVLGSRLAESAAGPDARIVPLHLSDNAVLDVVRSGDLVDILAAPASDSDAEPRLVATDAVVVLVSPKPKMATDTGDRVVLVALPETAATSVAGAALVQTVTLTLH